MSTYLESEKHLYTPPDCAGCGKRVEQEWLDVTTSWGLAADRERSYMPGLWQCNTVGCQYGPPRVEVFS